MQTMLTRTVFDVITDFLTTNPAPEDILAYHLPDELQARVDGLIERNGEGLLTFEDQQELFDYMRVDEMMSLWKAKTRAKLQDAGA